MFSHSITWKIILGLLSTSVYINDSFEYTRFCNGYGFIGELHIPGYNYCGPGTKVLSKQNEAPKDELDEACKQHDLVYCNTNYVNEHCKSDLALIKVAESRQVADNASPEEKVAAWLVKKGMVLYMDLRSIISSCKCSVSKGSC